MNVLLPEIRPGKPGELETFADFWLAMFEEIGVLREAQMRSDWRARFETYFRARIAAGQARFFVALDDRERITGTAGALVADGYPFEIHGVKRGYIFGVRVAPEHRGRGTARRLTQSCIDYLRASQCARIRLHASPAGRPIYERLGFVPTNEMELRD